MAAEIREGLGAWSRNPSENTVLRARAERDSLIDNLLVRIHFIIEMIWRTGLAPWEFELRSRGNPLKNAVCLGFRGLGSRSRV